MANKIICVIAGKMTGGKIRNIILTVWPNVHKVCYKDAYVYL